MWLGSTDSTNELARRHISEIDNLSVLSALEQTTGRGQRGNTWSSRPGENLTFSIVLKFAGPDDRNINGKLLPCTLAYDQFILTEIASLSVIRFLKEKGIHAGIKWPNDIYVGSKKICGMLIENSVRGKYISSSIIGIGLNINQRNFNVNLPNPTSLIMNTSPAQGDEYDIRLCLEEFMKIFISYLESFFSALTLENKENHFEIRKEYLSNLWLLDSRADFIDLRCGEKRFNGIIRGVSPIGHILIEESEKGELEEFAFKEIGYVITR